MDVPIQNEFISIRQRLQHNEQVGQVIHDRETQYRRQIYDGIVKTLHRHLKNLQVWSLYKGVTHLGYYIQYCILTKPFLIS